MAYENHSEKVKAGKARARAKKDRLEELSVILKTFGFHIVAGYYTSRRSPWSRDDRDFRFRLYHMDRPGKIDYFRDLEEITNAVSKLCFEGCPEDA